MKPETVDTIMRGLRGAGIDFIATLPFTNAAGLLPALLNEDGLQHVAVGNEGDGIVMCAGAWMGGKKPALFIENTAVVIGAYALTGLDGMYGGMPMLLLVDHRGSFGDGGGYWYFGGGHMAPIILDGLKIPHVTVREPDRVETEIVRGQQTAEAFGKPVAVLLSETDYW